MRNLLFKLSSLMSVFVLSIPYSSSYAQEEHSIEATTNQVDVGSSYSSTNSFAENTFSQQYPNPTPGINLTGVDTTNYGFNAFYWNGTSTDYSNNCSVSGPPHGFHILRDGVVIDQTSNALWGIALQDTFVGFKTVVYYCGDTISRSNMRSQGPGRYTLRYSKGGAYVGGEVYLFTIPVPPPPSAPCANTIPLYGAVNWGSTDFYLTLDPNLMNYLGSMGFTYAGVIAKIPNYWSATTAPFQRFYFGPPITSHFYTTNDTEMQTLRANGWTYENNEGFLFTQQVTGTVPLYRVGYQAGSDMMFYYTTNTGIVNNLRAQPGWVNNAIAGFVCPI